MRDQMRTLLDAPLPSDREKFAKASTAEKPDSNPSVLSRSNFIARCELDLSDVGDPIFWESEVVVRSVDTADRASLTTLRR